MPVKKCSSPNLYEEGITIERLLPYLLVTIVCVNSVLTEMPSKSCRASLYGKQDL